MFVSPGRPRLLGATVQGRREYPPEDPGLQGFHGHGGTPIAAWFLLGKILLEWMILGYQRIKYINNNEWGLNFHEVH